LCCVAINHPREPQYGELPCRLEDSIWNYQRTSVGLSPTRPLTFLRRTPFQQGKPAEQPRPIGLGQVRLPEMLAELREMLRLFSHLHLK